jgi:predicted transcriptional regulator
VAGFIPKAPGQATGAGVLAVAVGLLYWFWPTIKGAGAIGLFSRLKEPAVLEHPHRSRIMRLVEAQPGLHFNGLLRLAGMGNGTLAHHLDVLVKNGRVRRVPSGGYTCYFPNARGVSGVSPMPRSPGAQKVMQAIRARPGISNLEVAHHTGLDPGTVHYHVQRLAHAGLVRPLREGRTVRLHAAPQA